MLKHTMLDQELTFRNQVHELHRLYRAQRTFMGDLGWKEIETCDLWDESSQSTAMPVANPARYGQLAVETAHSSISTVGSTQIFGQDFSGECRGLFYKPQQRALDFHHPAASFFTRGNVWNHSPETMKLKRSLNGGDISDSDDLKLSLSIGDEKRRKRANKGKWLHNKTPPCSIEIIDLEQDEDEDATGPMHSGAKNESQVSVISDQVVPTSVKKDQSHSVADGTSFKTILLDLNEVYIDESSCYSNEDVIQSTVNQSAHDSYSPQSNSAAANLDQVCENLGSHNSDSKETLKMDFSKGCKNGEAEDSVDSHSHQSKDWDINKSPPSCQQISISDKLSGNHVGSQVAEMKHKGGMNKGESAEVDIFIQSAAESLLHISLESSASAYAHECSTKEGSNEVENEEKEVPCDSYEALTLNLAESNVDEYCVSSKPFEVFDSEMKEFGLKLRRGRRLKDFQKEILPSLASLARHEISEDINIMEGVLRSREYKRLRGKLPDGETWSSPLTRKRSTGKRGGRRTRK